MFSDTSEDGYSLKLTTKVKGGKMVKKKSNDVGLKSILNLVLWLAGVLVSLAVGFGMIDGTLSVPYVYNAITAVAGWIVVILTLLGIILGILERFS